MNTRKLIVGNWKMKVITPLEAERLFRSLQNISRGLRHIDVISCPSAIHLDRVGKIVDGEHYIMGAQDCFYEERGSFTGEISPTMLLATGVKAVILGHSERRALGETDESVNKKVKKLLELEMIPIICIGEETRDTKKKYLTVVKNQLLAALEKVPKKYHNEIIVAYEPIWAIGSAAKQECSAEECHEVAMMIRTELKKFFRAKNLYDGFRVLYGGSVDHTNARSFFEEGGVDGVLLGRASLDPKIMSQILYEAELVAKTAHEHVDK